MSKVSILIPARNEPYLQKTILDILQKCRGEVEILAILDGYWCPAEEIVDDKRVNYLHYSEAKGMRAGINMGVALAKGEYILKCDAHCMFDEGFDVKLAEFGTHEYIYIPSRFPLDPVNWKIEARTDNKYPIEEMYLSEDLHAEEWRERRDLLGRDNFVETMSSQGSCWFMEKDYFNKLELLDEETYGIFWNEMQEIGLKCWLSGGKMLVNRNTWYAHWHKTEGRGYSLDKTEQPKAQEAVKRWLTGQGWHKQIHPVSWLIEKFAPVPGWEKK